MKLKFPSIAFPNFRTSTDGKFGTIEGVFIPNVLQMVGVILFLRLSWVLGYTGIFAMSLIISLSALILFLTGLSITSIVSNMQMGGGGAYYLISRSLGIEFGGAIGILICLSQLCSIALCVTGFSLSLYEFLPSIPLWAIKATTLTSLVVISYISTDFALKTQFIIFVALVLSFLAIFFASGSAPEHISVQPEKTHLTFWAAFAMFFPGMTGIESGMSMSGDLRNPSRSLPIGTLGAIGVVYALYLGIAFFLSKNVSPELLQNYPFILYYISKAGYLIIIGIWAATLSSALGAILGGPRVIQAVARDGILPRFLAKGYGQTNQPRVATVAVFLLGMFLTLATNINQIIPMLTMACLVSYGLINFIAFFESFIQNPSWRPSFKISSVIPFMGGMSCFVAMFMINPGATFIVLSLVILLCFWTVRRQIQGNWDDLRHSIFSFFVHKGTVKLSSIENSAKSWRPHILTIFETPVVNKNLAYFSHALNQERGFLTFGAVAASEEQSKNISQNIKDEIKEFKIPSHVHISSCADSMIGIDQMIRNYGLGLLKPNTVILPAPEIFEVDAFVQLLLEANQQEKNVLILKTSYQKDNLFSEPNKRKQIDLWWRGKYPGNFELCLAYAYILQQSALWPESKIHIKMLVSDEERRKKAEEQFNHYQSKLRIQNLSFSSYVHPENDFFINFPTHSEGADLIFLGLKKPEKETSVAEYREYFMKLLKNTESQRNIAYVLSGEKIKFRKIFIP